MNQPSRRLRTLVVLGVTAALALTGGACGDDDDDGEEASSPTTDSGYSSSTSSTAGSDSSTTAPAEGGDEATLVVSNFTFSEVTGAAGATVPVRNDDQAPHTVTADDDSFDSGEVDPGGTGEFTAPSEPGSYPIHCEIHSQMSGTVTVS